MSDRSVAQWDGPGAGGDTSANGKRRKGTQPGRPQVGSEQPGHFI